MGVHLGRTFVRERCLTPLLTPLLNPLAIGRISLGKFNFLTGKIVMGGVDTEEVDVSHGDYVVYVERVSEQ
jgi:hypothetical protein